MEKKIKISSNKNFGIVFSIFFLLISIYLLLNNNPIYYWSLFVSFIFKLAKDGYQKALKNDQNFLAGLNVHKGNITYKAVADVFGHKYLSPSKSIA